MKIFFSFCTFISCIIVILIVVYSIKYLFDFIRFKSKNESNEKFTKKFIPSFIFANDDKKGLWAFGIFSVIFVIGIMYISIITLYPSKQIGSVFEGSSYEAKYYINLFENTNDTTNYRVAGQIKATTEDNKKIYYLKKIYLNNGNAITFNKYSEISELKKNKKVPIEDDNNKQWYVELTTERVK